MQAATQHLIIRLCDSTPHLLQGLDALHRAFLRDSSVPPEQFMEFVTKRLEDEAMLIVLAMAGERPVGYGLAFDVVEHPFMPEWQRSGYITQLYVAPEHRRRGLGQRLVEFIFEWMASRGLEKVMLNVMVDEPPASRFWQKQGFSPHQIRMKRQVREKSAT